MRTLSRIVLVLVVIAGAFSAAPASAQEPAPWPDEVCAVTSSPAGGKWLTCVPPVWNGDLLVFAHGYIPAGAPLDFYHLTTIGDTPLPYAVLGLGYAFAATTYPENGLVRNGANDLVALTDFFWKMAAMPPLSVSRGHTFLVGASEGGLMTTLAVERAPRAFSGGLALCGPIGSFRKQIDHFEDFRVLFDYFYPGVLPPSPLSVPPELMAGWETVYTQAVVDALSGDPLAAAQLISTSKAAIDPANPATVADTTLGVLWYSVFATNDAIFKLHGNPFDNRLRWYWGSTNDRDLNMRVQRFAADSAALLALRAYETSGRLSRPLVTMHTTGDPVVPFWHEILYTTKASLLSPGKVIPIPISAYGHCSFTQEQVLAGFGLLVWAATGQQPAGLTLQFEPGQVQQDWARAQQDWEGAQLDYAAPEEELK